ncbi:Multifunctional methyltransferase subunit TRM112-like protein [Gracilariopsis chorda]|uniref:Multifunctional methyltransferase subunit TRM112-like protein n=1 Tax=Gracilariopsis chorda TaxID=448386 RepID=A0A2V3II14_9FLOR|nr:Multifunctional methyltransferase subunit TRM112-like protein [Gracilariopsis chorda]|eukprot:PXF41678.1 Multifunctional methyltransferase subunit TRM112-like protein [Gracilariopsis chorda]
MRLLTHNMLHCPRTKAYPLQLVASTCDDVQVPFSEAFIRRMLPRIQWEVFREAAAQFPDEDMLAKLPESTPQPDTLDEPTLKAIHRALLEWHVVDGTLKAENGSEYAVKNGIPNLVITEVRKESGGADDANSGDAAMDVDDKGQ